jgi:hypothetical protein
MKKGPRVIVTPRPIGSRVNETLESLTVADRAA